MKGLPRLVLELFVVCAIAAGALSFVNAATKDRIAGFARQEREQALKQVFPAAEEFREVLPGRQWQAMAGGTSLGYVFEASIQGYGGPIVSFFGLDSGDKVTGVKVVSQSETPGLGAKVAGQKFLGQFRGKAPEQLALRRDDPRGGIDGVTAATISSRALTSSLRNTVQQYLKGELK
jgi:electron transport complex protein RnfG